ncbi:sigma-70 family RNA polymerase sigma factor [Roseateles sp. BYS87W]|uniref:Sigma-70 family RNA polymerase sigma factor n=1 Tax=Pelomonas baiyunensis TaxID=3299026 RepID=A0ABW7H1U6_9BURK
MSRPLRKNTLDGIPYCRRDVVEAELADLAAISPQELEARAAARKSSAPGFVSPEALLYFIRNAPAGTHRDKLTQALLDRVVRLARSTSRSSGAVSSLTEKNIQEEVVDHFVDLLLSDRGQYDERLDYYEVNFNSAVASDRYDASDRHWKHENRSEELGTNDDEVPEHVHEAMGDYDPFNADALDEKDYWLLLDDAIDNLPEFQRRIVVMLRQEVPIESSDPSVSSISEVLCKTPKTIATHRDKAFASLRRRLERKGRL